MADNTTNRLEELRSIEYTRWVEAIAAFEDADALGTPESKAEADRAWKDYMTAQEDYAAELYG